MGMDVHGKSPTSEAGSYFRNNVWWWRPLADYIVKIAPALAAKCKGWQYNDGDGLDGPDSLKLAAILQAEIDTGRTAKHAAVYASEQEMSPDVPCTICAGTGTRPPVPMTGAGDPLKGGFKCNGCDGKGTVRPNGAHYPFSVENVQEFIVFLKDCGGFSID